jgi:hypothetical protein
MRGKNKKKKLRIGSNDQKTKIIEFVIEVLIDRKENVMNQK